MENPNTLVKLSNWHAIGKPNEKLHTTPKYVRLLNIVHFTQQRKYLHAHLDPQIFGTTTGCPDFGIVDESCVEFIESLICCKNNNDNDKKKRARNK